MNDRKEHDEQSSPRTENATERPPAGRTTAPPIEREHETAAGVFEEEEERKKERS